MDTIFKHNYLHMDNKLSDQIFFWDEEIKTKTKEVEPITKEKALGVLLELGNLGLSNELREDLILLTQWVRNAEKNDV